MQGLKSNTLYIVSTPIGNIQDITLRAIDTLKCVDLILCENVLNSKKLLSSYGITTKCIEFNDHASDSKAKSIIDDITTGKKVALISDAGTPTISDPGFKLIDMCYKYGIAVIPIPGCSAIISALSVCPFPKTSFRFCGFFPKGKSDAISILKSGREAELLCFYESPNRVHSTFQLILETLGDVEVFIGREMTKLFEEYKCAKVSELIQHFTKPKGEFVITIKCSVENQLGIEQYQDDIDLLLSQPSKRDIIDFFTRRFNLSKNEVYKYVIK